MLKKMKKAELEKYKKLLLDKKEDVLNELKHIQMDTLNKSQRDASGDLSGYTLHMADVATDNYDREFSLGIATGGQKILYDIDEALKRIEDKEFGNCQLCSKPIPKTRLKVVPYTKYCLVCQKAEESKKKS